MNKHGEPELDSIGLNIYKYRKEAGITQKQLALDVGISVSSISAIERGAIIPSIETTEKIALALNVTVDHLLSDNILGHKDVNQSREMKSFIVRMNAKQRKDFAKIIDILSKEE